MESKNVKPFEKSINQATLLAKLAKIQSELKAPKNLRNTFGNYNYRNAESILEAFKPFGQKYNVSICLSDEIINIGNRFYVKANAIIYDCETGEKITVSASAREPESKKGMDESQITGTASSYARKYALNGLLLLDDTKDADTDEHADEVKSKPEAKVTKAQLKTLLATAKEKGINTPSLLATFNKDKLEDFTIEDFKRAMDKLEKLDKKGD